MSELDALRRLGDQIVPPPFEALEETARRRARRARVASVAVAACVVAASIAGVYAGRAVDHQIEPAPPFTPESRPLTYADGSTIHFGDQTVEAEGPVVELDLTDDGIGFRTDDGGIWFTDGSETERLGSLGETGPGYRDPWPLTMHPGWMTSANSGSRLAWFHFPAPGEPEVVVYDTDTRTEVARATVRLQPGHTAVPAFVTGSFIYWFQDPSAEDFPEDQTQVRFDPATGDQSRITEGDLLADLDTESARRSVLLKEDGRADSSGKFHYSDGMELQMTVDLREGVHAVGGGDMVAKDVNGKLFEFDAPPGYAEKSGVAWLVQWIDDKTVVVLNPLRQHTDLVVCHVDTGKCDAAKSVATGIVVPEFGTSQFIG